MPRDFMMLLTLIMTLMMVISITGNSFKKNNIFYSVLVTSLQTERGRELVQEFEGEMQDPSFQNYNITTSSQMLHNMRL